MAANGFAKHKTKRNGTIRRRDTHTDGSGMARANLTLSAHQHKNRGNPSGSWLAVSPI